MIILIVQITMFRRKTFWTTSIIAVFMSLGAMAQGVEVALQPLPFDKTESMVFGATKLVNGWCHDGIHPDSADFKADDGKQFRTIVKGDRAVVFRLDNSGERKDQLFAYSWSSYKPSVTNELRSGPVSPLISSAGQGHSYYLFPKYHEMLEDSLAMYGPIWLYQTRGVNKAGAFQNAKLSLVQLSANNYWIRVTEYLNDTIVHQDEIRRGRVYKEMYHEGDTLSLSSSYFRIDSIRKDLSSVMLTPVTIEPKTVHVSDDILAMLRPLFKKRKYMLIDFGGSAFYKKTLNALDQAGRKVSKAMSVVITNPNSTLDEYRDVPVERFHEKGIAIQVIDDRQQVQKLWSQLKVTQPTTYVLINKKGEIIFNVKGEKRLMRELKDFCHSVFK